MRSTPITLVLLSFPHNRSLSLYSPLLNWSILHLNHDISTLLVEKGGENKYKWAPYVKWHNNWCLTSEDCRISSNYNVKNKDRNICKRAGAVLLFWFELQSLKLINTHLNLSWGGLSQYLVSSEKGKHAIISNDYCRGNTSWMLIEAYFIFIQQNFYISTWAHNCLIYMHTHTFIYSHNSQWTQSILPSPYSAPCS